MESYPERVDDRSVSGSFLHNGTASMFEHHGFERTRPVGKNHWVVTKVLAGPRDGVAASRSAEREHELTAAVAEDVALCDTRPTTPDPTA